MRREGGKDGDGKGEEEMKWSRCWKRWRCQDREGLEDRGMKGEYKDQGNDPENKRRAGRRHIDIEDVKRG